MSIKMIYHLLVFFRDEKSKIVLSTKNISIFVFADKFLWSINLTYFNNVHSVHFSYRQSFFEILFLTLSPAVMGVNDRKFSDVFVNNIFHVILILERSSGMLSPLIVFENSCFIYFLFFVDSSLYGGYMNI